MTRQQLRLGLVGLAVVAGLGLKAMRYSGQDVATLGEAQRRVTSFMSIDGWAANGGLQHRSGELYSYLIFKKAGCAQHVAVAFLAGNNESAELMRRDAGGDLAFVQDGEVLAQPSGAKRQIAIVTAGLSSLVGGQQASRLPVLAVSPAPQSNQGPCSGPAAAAWQRIGSVQ